MVERLIKRIDKVDVAILAFFLISLVLGILVVDDYGLSWDEYKDLSYGEVVLKAYQGSQDFLWEGGNRKTYGPVYWMFVGLISTFVKSLLDIQIVYVWKIINFITFQVGILSFYHLSKRFMARIPAIVTTTFFMTQPLLWGHAFINPKDIPFMSFFLLCVALSLRGFDAFNQYTGINDDHLGEGREIVAEKWDSLRSSWKATSRSRKTIMVFLILLFLIVTIEFIFLKSIILPFLQTVVRDAYQGISIPLINSLFERIAQDAYKTSMELYLGKISRLYDWFSWLITIGFALVVWFTCRRLLFGRSQKIDWRDFLKRISFFIIPGLFLGLIVSIRIVGLSMGALFSVYFLYKARGKAVIPLIFYWSFAAFITFATWPYLWDSTISRFFESINQVGSYTSHHTLFQGEFHLSTNMPFYYLPFLIVIQLTEPVILLLIIGIPLCVKKVRSNDVDLGEILLLAGWFIIPILTEIILRIPIYDNFRQFLFILPPLFLFSGFGVSFLLERLDRYLIGAIALVIFILPGIVGIVNLHPYEYVYYNSFAGGTGNAYGEYELDYWCISLREAIEFLNENAEPNSYVYISGPHTAAEPFAREDLKITYGPSISRSSGYVIGCRNDSLRDDFFLESEIIYKIGFDEGVFAIVKVLEAEDLHDK